MNLDSIELSDLKVEKIKMMGEFVLIEAFERKEIQGFIIPDNKKEKPTVGKVIKVGNGVVSEKEIKMTVKEGDIVIFNEWSAKQIEGLKDVSKNKKIFYLKQSDIIGFLGGEDV